MAHLLDVPDQIIDTSEIEVLLREYLAWAVPLFNRQNDLDLDEEAALEAALAGLPECLPPEGCTVLARRGDGTANAVVFFQRIRSDAAEIKRLYLRPDVRGDGLGRRMVQRLIDEARRRGYKEIYLDTAAFMSSAHGLYRSLGFRDIDGYPEAAHQQDVSPHVIYMALSLG